MPAGLIIFLLVAALVVAVSGLPAGLGLFPPWNATTVARIRDGKISMKRGQWRGQIRDDVEEALRDAGVLTGFIALTSESRVHFSRNIPEVIRQRLRNVLLN